MNTTDEKDIVLDDLRFLENAENGLAELHAVDNPVLDYREYQDMMLKIRNWISESKRELGGT